MSMWNFLKFVPHSYSNETVYKRWHVLKIFDVKYELIVIFWELFGVKMKCCILEINVKIDHTFQFFNQLVKKSAIIWCNSFYLNYKLQVDAFQEKYDFFRDFY